MKSQAWLALLIGAAVAQNATLEANVVEYCKDFNLTSYTETNLTLRAQMRNDSRTPLSISMTTVLNAYNNGDYAKVVTAVVAPLVLLVIFCVLAFFSVIFFCSFLCCCDRASAASESKAKCNSYVALGCAVVMAAMIITTFVFLGRTNESVSEVRCGVNAINRDIINGVNANGLQFLGLDPLAKLLGNFKQDINNLNVLVGDFDAIISKKLPQLGVEANATLTPFYDKFKSSQTYDGAGAKATPKSISTLTSGINDAVQTNFAYLMQITDALDQAARQGKQYIDPLVVQSITDSIQNIIDYLATFTASINDSLGIAVAGLNVTSSGAKSANIVTIIVMVLLIIFCLVVCLVLCMMTNGKLLPLRCPVKLAIVFLSFLSFLFALTSLAVYATAMASSTSCEGIYTVLETQNFTDLFAQWNITGSNMTKLLDTCVGPNGNGDISGILGTPDMNSTFGNVNTFLDGFTQVKQLRQNLTQDKADSIAINMTADVWAKLRSGLYPDHQKAVEQLYALNQLLDCDSKSFQFNAANCTASGCMALFDTASYSPPACATPVASTYFSQLKDYQSDEQSLIDQLTAAVRTGDNTPNGKYRVAFLAIVDVVQSIDKIISALSNTLSVAQNFTSGFSQQVNCTVIRQDLYILESTLCFRFSKASYIFFVFLVIMAVMVFLFACASCCTLHCLPDQGKPMNLVEAADNTVNNTEAVLLNKT